MQISNLTPLVFQDELLPKETRLIGFSALVEYLKVQAPVRKPACVSTAHVRGSVREEASWRVFDKRYQPEDTVSGHLTFALRHEVQDFLLWKRIFAVLPEEALLAYIKETPTGMTNRRAWFYYEFLMNKPLNLPDAAANIPAVEALDSERYFTSKGTLSKRHRVRNNLLGTPDFCPIIQRTETLEDLHAQQLGQQASETLSRVSNQLVARAASFLLLADSRASFAIEGERPPRGRLEPWLKAVKQAGKHPLTLDEIVRLHGLLIADNRFVRLGLRTDGVFLGERSHDREPIPEFIGARPDNLTDLLQGLITANAQMQLLGLDPVLQAAAIAFGFVYIHPLEDGNGRLHRYLIHHVLAERKFSTPGVLFPVSSVLLERIETYQQVLRNHSGPLMPYIEWRGTESGNVEVLNDTMDLYRYFDCTEAAEFLYQCIQRTIEHDLPKELYYLKRHDQAMQRMMDTVSLSDRQAEDFILFTRQNDGVLPKSRRKKEFEALSDAEVLELQQFVNEAFEDMEFS